MLAIALALFWLAIALALLWLAIALALLWLAIALALLWLAIALALLWLAIALALLWLAIALALLWLAIALALLWLAIALALLWLAIALALLWLAIALAVLAKASADVIFSFFLLGMLKDIHRWREFNQSSREKEPGILRDARRLLHIVRHNHNSIVLRKLRDQFLDLQRGNGVEGRAWLIHKQHFRPHGQRPRDTQALLLSARQTQSGGAEAIFNFVPQSRTAQALLNCLLYIFA